MLQQQPGISAPFFPYPHLPEDILVSSAISSQMGFLLPVFVTQEVARDFPDDPFDRFWDLLFAARNACDKCADQGHANFRFANPGNPYSKHELYRISVVPAGNSLLISFPWEV